MTRNFKLIILNLLILSFVLTPLAQAASFVYGGVSLDLASVTTAAGTTTLTNASKQVQRFTGSTTQTVKLPAANTLRVGYPFVITNESSGTLTVKDDGSNTLTTVAAGTSSAATTTWFFVANAGSANGTWNIQASGSGGGSGSSGKFWTGHHGNDCNWVQSPGSLSDFSDDGSCTFTQQLESGFTGKVVTYGASKPGLAITAPDTGYLQTCVSGDVMNGAANNIVEFDLYDGTNGMSSESNGNTSYYPFRLCITTAVTAASTYNVRLRGWAPSTGTIALLNGGRGKLTWTVNYQ